MYRDARVAAAARCSAAYRWVRFLSRLIRGPLAAPALRWRSFTGHFDYGRLEAGLGRRRGRLRSGSQDRRTGNAHCGRGPSDADVTVAVLSRAKSIKLLADSRIFRLQRIHIIFELPIFGVNRFDMCVDIRLALAAGGQQ